MSETSDSFMPTGKLLIETGLDGQGDHSWRFELDGMSQTEAIGVMVVLSLRYVFHTLGMMRTMGGEDDEGPETG